MNAGWMFLRTELRKRWRSWLALALIVGAFAGAVEAAAAGARRTDAAYPALLTWSGAPDLMAASAVGQSVFGHISQSALARLPQVAGKALLAEYAVAPAIRRRAGRPGDRKGTRDLLAAEDPGRPPPRPPPRG